MGRGREGGEEGAQASPPSPPPKRVSASPALAAQAPKGPAPAQCKGQALPKAKGSVTPEKQAALQKVKAVHAAMKQETEAKPKAAALPKASEASSAADPPGSQWLDESFKPLEKVPIAIDWHNVIELKGTVPQQSLDALERLEKGGFHVHVVSYAGKQRAKEVRALVKGLGDKAAAWDLHIVDARCGPLGKAAFCLEKGIFTIVDDGADICKECLDKGMTVYPIQTHGNEHAWALSRCGRYTALHKAVDVILAKHLASQEVLAKG